MAAEPAAAPAAAGSAATQDAAVQQSTQSPPAGTARGRPSSNWSSTSYRQQQLQMQQQRALQRLHETPSDDAGTREARRSSSSSARGRRADGSWMNSIGSLQSAVQHRRRQEPPLRLPGFPDPGPGALKARARRSLSFVDRLRASRPDTSQRHSEVRARRRCTRQSITSAAGRSRGVRFSHQSRVMIATATSVPTTIAATRKKNSRTTSASAAVASSSARAGLARS
jgi:hypothetical protein